MHIYCLGYPSQGMCWSWHYFKNIFKLYQFGKVNIYMKCFREHSWLQGIVQYSTCEYTIQQIVSSLLAINLKSLNAAQIENWSNSTPHWLSTTLQRKLNVDICLGTHLVSFRQSLTKTGNLHYSFMSGEVKKTSSGDRKVWSTWGKALHSNGLHYAPPLQGSLHYRLQAEHYSLKQNKECIYPPQRGI